MLSVKQGELHSPHSTHLQQLHRWFTGQWGEVDAFESTSKGLPVPLPLLALDGEELLGGLSFCRYPLRETGGYGLWINALFVSPPYRGRGVASALVSEAVKLASDFREGDIHVLTEVPALYEKLGWQTVAQEAEGCILVRRLMPAV